MAPFISDYYCSIDPEGDIVAVAHSYDHCLYLTEVFYNPGSVFDDGDIKVQVALECSMHPCTKFLYDYFWQNVGSLIPYFVVDGIVDVPF